MNAFTNTRTRSKPEKLPSLVTVDHDGGLYISSVTMAEVFGVRHDNVLRAIRKVRAEGVGLLKLEESSYLNKQGKTQPCYLIPEHEALIIMPFVGGRNAVMGQVRLVGEFMAMRKELRRLERRDRGPDWRKTRPIARDLIKELNQTLQDCRFRDGKGTAAHHFINEAKLINLVVMGCSKTGPELHTPEQLRLRVEVLDFDRRLVTRGRDYADRKADLSEYVRARTPLRPMAEVREVAHG